MSKKKQLVRGATATAVLAVTIMSGMSFGAATASAAAPVPNSESRNAPVKNQKADQGSYSWYQSGNNVCFDSTRPSGYTHSRGEVWKGGTLIGKTADYSSSSACAWVDWDKAGVSPGGSMTAHFGGRFWSPYDGYPEISWPGKDGTITRPLPTYNFSAYATYSADDDSFRTKGTTKNIGSTIEASSDNGATWTSLGKASGRAFDLPLDRTMTTGGTIRVREGSTGTGSTVSLRSAAVTELAGSVVDKKRVLAGKAANNAKIHVSSSDLAADDYLSFNATSNGTFKDIDLSAVPQQVREVTVWQGDNGIRTRVQLPTLLGAVAKDIDIEAGTATLDGFAPEGATAVDVTWNGVTRDATVNADGSWSFDLTGLALGSNTVRVEAWNGSESYGEFTLDVNLAVAGLTANATFDDDVSEDVTLAGEGQKDATIEVRSGEKIVAKTTVGQGNTWSVQLPAPNTFGNYDLQVVQKVRGEEYGAEDLTVDYGRGVDITSPVGQADADDNGRIVVLGDAQKKTPVELYEVDADGKIVGEALGQTTSTNPTDGDKGTFRIVVNNLDEREYKIVAQQHGKGNNITTSDPVVINPGQSNVVAPTAEVVFDADVTKKATVTGTGVDGATITVKNGTQTLGTTTVAGGEWSLPIDPIGAGQHTLTIEQNGAEGTQTATTVADYGNAVEFTTADGVSFADGKLTVAGKSVQGAKIAIRTGGKQVDSFTVDRADGSFSRELSGLGSGTISLTATADSRGGLRTEDALAATSPVHVEALSVASHVKGGTFVPGTQAFTGHATAGATVSLNPFGFDPKYAAQTLTTTANQFGEWTINRGLADVPYPFISFKQTPQTGVVNELINYDLKPYREIGEPGDLTLTNFKAGDFYNPGDQIFTGTATPGATVTLNPFGFDPRYASYNLVTTADETTGQWQVRRGLAAGTVYRELAVKQDPEAEGKVNRIEKITVAANDWVGAPADLKLTAPGTSFTPGTEQTFTGAATPGTTVTLYPFGDDRYADIKMTTKVDATGAWTIKRGLANQAYPIVVTQTEQTGKVNRVAQTMTPAN